MMAASPATVSTKCDKCLSPYHCTACKYNKSSDMADEPVFAQPQNLRIIEQQESSVAVQAGPPS